MIFSDVQTESLSLYEESRTIESTSIVFEVKKEMEKATQSGGYIYCKCAYVNIGWLARQVGLGNRQCLARNIGSICHHGEDVECQSRNTNCGGTNPDPDVN